ncbi:MAG: trypsin-like peptidase domain-containing protein [Proteobacteria bacterium]|nr:trypsin-like peptidase domain-containing protein [Pseudomonadota bacterium]
MKLYLGFLVVLSSASCGRPVSRNMKDVPSKLQQFAGVQDYQIGPEWGKQPVTSQNVATLTPELQRAAKATAYVGLGFGGATAFVIGQKDGSIRMATNHHVIGKDSDCRKASIKFPLLGISGLKCEKLIGTWNEIDLTVFVLAGGTTQQRELILSVAQNFAFDHKVVKGTKMFSVGFGVAGNSGQKNMMTVQDEDCKVYSKDSEVRLMKDPDEINPGPDLVWGFAFGCDVSHGDSGSAVLDRDSGEVMGIVFTGKIPKVSTVRDRSWLDNAFETNSESVWKELNFAVPAAKIAEVTRGVLE